MEFGAPMYRNQLSIVHSFNKYLLSRYMPGLVLGAWDTAINRCMCLKSCFILESFKLGKLDEATLDKDVYQKLSLDQMTFLLIKEHACNGFVFDFV